jgi:hypothetical protein
MKTLLSYLKQSLHYAIISGCLLCLQGCPKSGASAGAAPKATSALPAAAVAMESAAAAPIPAPATFAPAGPAGITNLMAGATPTADSSRAAPAPTPAAVTSTTGGPSEKLIAGAAPRATFAPIPAAFTANTPGLMATMASITGTATGLPEGSGVKDSAELDRLGEELYAALINNDSESCEKIVKRSQTDANLTWYVVGYALNKALDTNCTETLWQFLWSKLALIKGAEIIDCIIYSWLQKPANIAKWKIPQYLLLGGEYPEYKLNKLIHRFFELELSNTNSLLTKYFQEAAKSETVQHYKKLWGAIHLHGATIDNIDDYSFLLKAIPLHGGGPVSIDAYLFPSLAEHVSSPDSEEEEEAVDSPHKPPHFNGVYNYSKSKYTSSRIDNAVGRGELISRAKLKEDADEIWAEATRNDKHNGKYVCILCVVLRQKDGRNKKFVFTNQSMINTAIYKAANKRGYHLIIAQNAHAEGEMMQFLQERPTRYTHLIAMGCNYDHCDRCDKMMKKEVHADYRQVSGSGLMGKTPFWYLPPALVNVLLKKALSREKLQEDFEPNWLGDKEDEKLTGESWAGRHWKRDRGDEKKEETKAVAPSSS